MRRYLRLYLCFLRFSFSRAMEFRVDFFFRVFMDTIWYAVQLAFFTVLYRHTQLLGGLTYDQVLVFAGSLFVIDAIHMTVFSNNMYWFPFFVNRGDVDFYLVRPVSSLFFLSVREFAANSFLNLLMAVGLLAWALLRYPGPLGAGSVAAYLALLLLGAFLYYILHMIFLLPVFWLHVPHGLQEVFYSVANASQRPHRIYTGLVRRLLVTVLPFAIVISFPVEALFSGPSAGLVLHTAAVVGGMFAFLLWLWRRALRAYVSASS